MTPLCGSSLQIALFGLRKCHRYAVLKNLTLPLVLSVDPVKKTFSQKKDYPSNPNHHCPFNKNRIAVTFYYRDNAPAMRF